MKIFTQYPPVTFTTQEFAVIQLLCPQHFSYEIAEKLTISVSTLKSLRKRIKSKMKDRDTIGIFLRETFTGFSENNIPLQ